MHKIALFCIGKKDEKCYEAVQNEFVKSIKKYAKFEMQNIFNKKINQAQNSAKEAKKSYTEALSPYLLDDGYNVALHPAGKELDSFEFAKMLEQNSKIAFFIGGAYGFEENFLQKCSTKISLSSLTLSHKIAKLVLLEQIFRGLSIIHNHPYHK